jgi:hypothetical protein
MPGLEDNTGREVSVGGHYGVVGPIHSADGAGGCRVRVTQYRQIASEMNMGHIQVSSYELFIILESR